MNYKVLVLIKHFKRIHPCAHICKKGIHKSYSSHGLHNDHGAWNDDWIMAAFDAHINFFPIFIDSLLGAAMDGVGLIAARRIMSLQIGRAHV